MSIEAMRQALEYTKPGAFVPVDMHTTKLLVDALRAAIEQAEKQGQHWCTYCRGNNAHNCQFNTTIPRVHTYVTNTTAPAPRQEQYDQTSLELCEECGWKAIIPGDGCLVCARQKAKPVWIPRTHLEAAQREPSMCRVEPTKRLPDFVPLYTAPRQWVGLTNKDIIEMWPETSTVGWDDIRLIEAKLKGKNT